MINALRQVPELLHQEKTSLNCKQRNCTPISELAYRLYLLC